MSQKHVARRGDRTPGSQAPPPSATLAGRCTHESCPCRQVSNPGTRSAFQGRAGSFQLGPQKVRPAPLPRLAGHGEQRRPPFQSPLGSSLAPSPFLQTQALSLSGRAPSVLSHKRGLGRKNLGKIRAKNTQPTGRGRVSWPGSIRGPPETRAVHRSQGTRRPPPHSPV